MQATKTVIRPKLLGRLSLIFILGAILVFAFLPPKISFATTPQFAASSNFCDNCGDSSGLTLNVNVAPFNAGDILVIVCNLVVLTTTQYACTAPTDNLSNTYTLAQSAVCLTQAGEALCQTGYSTTTAAPTSVTCHYPAQSTANVYASCSAYIVDTPTFTGLSTGDNGGSPSTISSVTSFTADALVIANQVNIESGSITYTAGTGYTLISGDSNGLTFQGESGYNLGGSTTAPITKSANQFFAEIAFSFGTGAPTLTITKTVTGWVFPNFIDGKQTTNWIFVLGFLLFPLAFIGEIAAISTRGKLSLNPKSGIFLTLLGLIVGSTLGTFANIVPVVFPFIFGAILMIYIWRGS